MRTDSAANGALLPKVSLLPYKPSMQPRSKPTLPHDLVFDTRDDGLIPLESYSEKTHAVLRLVIMAVFSLVLTAMFLFLPYASELEPYFELMRYTAIGMSTALALYFIAGRVGDSIVATAGVFVDYAFMGACMYAAPILMAPALALFPLIAHTVGVRYGSLMLAYCILLGFVVLYGVSTAPWYAAHWPLLLLAFLLIIVIPVVVHVLFLALQREREAAKQASRAKTTFLATMSHELRTPLTAIVSATDVMMLEGSEHASTIRASARTLLDTVNDVLDLASIEHGTLPIEPIPFDFDEMVTQLIGSLSPRAAQQKIGLDLVVPEKIGTVLGDPRRFRQILLNLVGNAIKFTLEGHVEVEIKRRDGEVLMRVTDTGPGIPFEFHRAIFKPFFQVSSGPARQHGGTGLGLAIVSALTRLMKGTIIVESRPPKGATFIAVIPVGDASARQAGASLADIGAMIQAHRESIQARQILLVDDALNNLHYISALLTHAGHQVVTAASADEAETLMRARSFHLVLLDVNMPGRTGFDLIETLGSEGFTLPPVVFMTGDVTYVARVRSARLNAQGFITKPVDATGLLSAVERYSAAA